MWKTISIFSYSSRTSHYTAFWGRDKCDKKFLRKSHLNSHIKSKHLNIKHSCDGCEAQFTTSGALKMHMRIVHKGIKDDFSCSYCGQKFSRRNNRDQHVRDLHENTESHSCQDCGKSYKTIACLKDHFLKKHSDKKQSKYICTECGKQFDTKSHLNFHVETVLQFCKVILS